MSHNQTHEGAWGWLAIGLFVATWDLTQEESLTHAFQRGMEHPIYKYMLVGALGVTALHLTGLIPEAADPFYQLRLERGNETSETS